MIEVKNLTKIYGQKKAVNDLSFTVNDGEIFGFLGPNGAGKSTTMNIITGCLSATDGTVVIEGHDIFEEPYEAKKCIGYLPEQPPLYMDMKVQEYLTFVAEAKKVKKEQIGDEVKRVMERTSITDVKDKLIKTLSKGYKQRVGIAQALLGNPKVVILDEPTVGLDPRQILEIRDLIRNLGEEHTVILSSHILQEVNSVCDKIMIISHGKLKVCATPEELYQTYCGNRLLHLAARVDEERLRGILQDVSGEKEFKTEKDITEVEIQFEKEIIYSDGTDIRDRIYRKMCEMNVTLLEMYFKKPTLEQVFMELTQEE
ncbi:MAG: ABC transporter ATP-binding protein [Lachnospiraceae bacterium]|nr:ABC transporter ATP-binding protein [Lachnospiraceae bacterium]